MLQRIETFTGEKNVANYFAKTKYRMAYLCNNIKCKSLSNMCNYFINHIGKNSSLKNKNICKQYLY